MFSTFMGLETARRGLAAGRAGMDVTGHNVANANTPGYSRQRAEQAAGDPYTVPSLGKPQAALQLGTGVTVEQIRRIRDNFLDRQIRVETGAAGNWETQQDALGEIETVFSELSDSGLNAMLANFWNSWQELSKNAENSPIRAALVQNSISLANGINHMYSQLETIKTDQRDLANIYIDDINSKARQIAALNKQIVNITAAGDQPNDLLDRRDLLLDELSKVVNYTLTESAGGSVNVDIGTFNLVDGTSSSFSPISQITDWTSPQPWDQNPYDQITSGRLEGIKEVLAKLQGYEDNLDNMAAELIAEVNNVHSAGYGLDGSAGNDFFTGTGAADIAVDNAVAGDLNKVAAAKISGAPGDGSNALALARLKNSNIAGLDNFTFDNYYKNLTARLGVDTQESIRMTGNQQALVDQLAGRKESISGVSMDEEMTSLMQYQYAYNAAARVVTILDSMLDTLINRMAV